MGTGGTGGTYGEAACRLLGLLAGERVLGSGGDEVAQWAWAAAALAPRGDA